MNLTSETKAELREHCRDLIEWLNKNAHPHAKIIIDTISFELVAGVEAETTFDFVKG